MIQHVINATKKIGQTRTGGCLIVCSLLANATFAAKQSLDQNCFSPRMTTIISRAKDEINNRLYITLATVDNHSSPWNAPVYTAFDKKHHFYWMSSLTSQHSQNIRGNRKTFAVIYNSTVPEGTGFGVYLRGNSYELNSTDIEDINHGIAVIASRINRTYKRPASEFLYPNPRRVYKFIPRQAWVNTTVTVHGKRADTRLEITRCLL